MFLIDIKKVADSKDFVDYSFTASEAGSPGLLRLQKATGNITLVRPISGGQIGDPAMGVWREPETYFIRASRKVTIAWQQGEFPESMVFES